jgi:hypothetical protein
MALGAVGMLVTEEVIRVRGLRGLIRWVALKAHSKMRMTMLLILILLRVDISSLMEQMGALTVVMQALIIS